MSQFLSDIFKGPNGRWDFGRFAAFHSLTAYTLSFLYALFVLSKVPEWNNLGIGYAAVMGGAGLLIGVKDVAVAKANATTASGEA
jgi:hypothetical protein